jgi:hypothetical protein
LVSPTMSFKRLLKNSIFEINTRKTILVKNRGDFSHSETDHYINNQILIISPEPNSTPK